MPWISRSSPTCRSGRPPRRPRCRAFFQPLLGSRGPARSSHVTLGALHFGIRRVPHGRAHKGVCWTALGGIDRIALAAVGSLGHSAHTASRSTRAAVSSSRRTRTGPESGRGHPCFRQLSNPGEAEQVGKASALRVPVRGCTALAQLGSLRPAEGRPCILLRLRL